MKHKPSEPLIVGKKRYYKYKIIWEDIVGDSTLATENEFDKMSCADVHTECWIFNKTPDYVYSFASYRFLYRVFLFKLTGAFNIRSSIVISFSAIKLIMILLIIIFLI